MARNMTSPVLKSGRPLIAGEKSATYVLGMNTKLKLVRFVLAATFGSLLWAGCASPGEDYNYSLVDGNPPDLTKYRADTFPAYRTGLDDRRLERFEVPADPTITEAAGAERVY